jgi:hypothetical protein
LAEGALVCPASYIHQWRTWLNVGCQALHHLV